jgi:glutathione S-transferase
MISNECSDLIQLFNKPKLKLVTNIKDYQEELKQVLSSINKLIEGDFFLGSQISLIDIMIYPWFERWIIIEHYFEVQISNEYKQIKSWLKRMNERKSIVETKKLTNSEYYISRSEKMMTAKL